MKGYITVKDTWSYGDTKHMSHPTFNVKVLSTTPVRKNSVMADRGWRKVVFGKVNGRGNSYAFPIGTGSTRFHEVRK